MLDYRKVNALAKDSARARRLAEFLCTLPGLDWTDWEIEFLSAMRAVSEDLTTRQAEKLLELEDAAVLHDRIEGFSVRRLVDACALARDDLDSLEDVAFITGLHAARTTHLRRRPLFRLLRCARELGVIEPYAGRSLDKAVSDAA